MKRLLLHICCAPCSTWSIERLRKGYEITGFFYNPNVQPKEEYDLRLTDARAYCADMDVDFLEAGYEIEAWERAVRGREGDLEGGGRCRICYAVRLEKTAIRALDGGFDAFTTTLTTSPHKNAQTINSVGAQVSDRIGIPFVPLDLKKQDGFRKSVEMSRAHGLHRQDFCGCVYSRLHRPGSKGQKV